MATHILIATPTAGGVVKAGFATTLAKVMKTAHSAGWEVDYMTVDSAYISKARNLFAHTVLDSTSMTHLVMIDSDMAVSGNAIRRMIQYGKPVVAAVYSQRSINLGQFISTARNSPQFSVEDVTAAATRYNVGLQPEAGTRKVHVTDGFCRVEYVALGCSVIRRDAFKSLIEAQAVRFRPDAFLARSTPTSAVYGFFDEIVLENGDILSEDYSFCKRWLSIDGNEVWGLTDESVGHIGEMVFGVPYAKRLMQGKA